MEIAEHTTVVAEEGELFAGAAGRGGLEVNIPTCPEWNMQDLVRHLGLIHLWAAAHVDQPHAEPDGSIDLPDLAGFWPDLAGSWPTDDDLADWYRATNANLVRVLNSAPPDLERFTFLPAPSSLAMWARRQASETAMHRFDAENAIGVPASFEAVFAADALDELLSGFAPRRRKLPLAGDRTIHVHAEDTDDHWLLTIGPEVTTTSLSDGPADMGLTGTASDLYLVLWNRGEDSSVTVTGDQQCPVSSF